MWTRSFIGQALLLTGFTLAFTACNVKKEETKTDPKPGPSQPSTPAGSATTPPASSTTTSTVIPTTTPPSPTQQLPSEVTLMAAPEAALEISYKPSGDKIITSVSGRLHVTLSSPDVGIRMRLLSAESHAMIEPELESCKLTVEQFTNVEADGKLTFTLMAIDPKTEGLSTCMKKLSPLGMTGFRVRFTNVPAGQLDERRYPVVNLKVAPFSDGSTAAQNATRTLSACMDRADSQKLDALGCELEGPKLQLILHQTRTECARLATSEAVAKDANLEEFVSAVQNARAGLNQSFERKVNDKIKSCGFQGAFKLNADANGGELTLLRPNEPACRTTLAEFDKINLKKLCSNQAVAVSPEIFKICVLSAAKAHDPSITPDRVLTYSEDDLKGLFNLCAGGSVL